MPFPRKALFAKVATACLCLTAGLPAFGQAFFFEFFPHDEQKGCNKDAPLEKLAILSRFSIGFIALNSHENGRRVFPCQLDETSIAKESGGKLYQVIDDENTIQLYQNAQGLKEGVGIKFFLQERGHKPCSVFYSQNFPHGDGSDLDVFRLALDYTNQGNLRLRTSHNYLFLSLRFFKTGKDAKKKDGGILYFVNQHCLDNLPAEKRAYAQTVMKRISRRKNTYGKPVTLEVQARPPHRSHQEFITENVNLPRLLLQCDRLEGQRFKLSHITFFNVLDQEKHLLCSHLAYNAGQLSQLHGNNDLGKVGQTGIPINIGKKKEKIISGKNIFSPAQALRQVFTPASRLAESTHQGHGILPFSQARSVMDKKDYRDASRQKKANSLDEMGKNDGHHPSGNRPESLLNWPSFSLQEEAPVIWQPSVPQGFSQVRIDGHENNCLYRAFLSSIDNRWAWNERTSTTELRRYLMSELEIRLSSLDPALEPQRQALRQGMVTHFFERVLQATARSNQYLMDFIRQVPPNTVNPFAQEARRLLAQERAEQTLTYIRTNLDDLRHFLSETTEGQKLLLAYMRNHFWNHNGEMETAEAIGPILCAMFQRRMIVHIADDPASHLYERNQFGNENDPEVHLFFTTYTGLSRTPNHYDLLLPFQGHENGHELGVQAAGNPFRFQGLSTNQKAYGLQGHFSHDDTLARTLNFDDEECLSLETLTQGITPPESPIHKKEGKIDKISSHDALKEARDEYDTLCKSHPLSLIDFMAKRKEIYDKWRKFQEKFPFFEINATEKGLLAVLKAFLTGDQATEKERPQQLLAWKAAAPYMKDLPQNIAYWVPYQIAFLEDSLLSKKNNMDKKELKRILQLWREAELYEYKMTGIQKVDLYMGISSIFRQLREEESTSTELNYLEKAKKYMALIDNPRRRAKLFIEIATKHMKLLPKDQDAKKWAYLKEAEAYEKFMDLNSQTFLRDQLAHIGGYLFRKDPTTINMRINLYERALELNKNNNHAREQLKFLQDKEDRRKQREDHARMSHQVEEKNNRPWDKEKRVKQHQSDKKDDHPRDGDKPEKKKHHSDEKDDRSRDRGKREHSRR